MIRLTAILLAVALSQLGAGQQTIGLRELTERAKHVHPSLKLALSDLELARAQRAGVLAPFRPQLSLNAYGGFGSEPAIVPGTVEPVNYALLPNQGDGMMNATFMWRLFTFGRDRDLAQSASAAIRSKEELLRSQSAEITLGVRLAFADAQLKRETARAQRAARDIAAEVLKVTEARFNAGKVPESFVLRAKADFASTESDVAMAEADEASALATLWESAGLGQSGEVGLGTWDLQMAGPMTLSEALAYALNHRPELAAAVADKRQMGALASAAKKASLPELGVYGMNDWAGSVAANGASTYKAGIAISFPLGDGGQRRGAQTEAAAGQTRADASLKLIENRIQSEVASAWAQWQIVGVLARAAADELAAGKESFRIAMIRFKEGKAILAEVTDARAQVVKAELAVAQSVAFQEKAWSRLQRAIGAAS